MQSYYIVMRQPAEKLNFPFKCRFNVQADRLDGVGALAIRVNRDIDFRSSTVADCAEQYVLIDFLQWLDGFVVWDEARVNRPRRHLLERWNSPFLRRSCHSDYRMYLREFSIVRRKKYATGGDADMD
jgi:hypothetical protein